MHGLNIHSSQDIKNKVVQSFKAMNSVTSSSANVNVYVESARGKKPSPGVLTLLLQSTLANVTADLFSY